jgi:hypothetical protein
VNVSRKFSNGKLVEFLIDGVPQPLDEGGGGVLLWQPKRSSIPPDKWPLWAKALKLLAKPEDKGIGDVVARMIGDEKSEAFKKWYKLTFGKDCGCPGRQSGWNHKYPLPRESASTTN